GPSALNVITKMMGLILAVIGTQMFIDGAAEAYKTVFSYPPPPPRFYCLESTLTTQLMWIF
ncbi:MarC family protein, partial [Vibrio sp. D173a]|uniref:MarC family protein n=1 Tax=Vibrio sp. D173a TaxID=2836349 RepID=UPI00255563CC